jgi:dihydrodipicolinate synthase/N-acetylneuraminate lyase
MIGGLVSKRIPEPYFFLYYMTNESTQPNLPILATAVTPWTDDYRFDADAFRKQVQHIARGLTRHIYIFGTAGEGYAVSDAQFKEVATCFWECAQEEGVTPMLGIISLSLPTIIERIQWGRSLGFREFQLSLPAWGALNDVELDRFFAETCGRFQDCHFHHYNLARSNRVLKAADYERLINAHPNLGAVKASVSDPVVIREFMALAPRLQFFFTERGYVEARRLGACGFLISVASVNYEKAKSFVHGDAGFRDEAFASLQGVGKQLREICAGRYHIDGAFDKMLYRVSDPEFPLRLLPPYEGPTPKDFEQFRAGIPTDWRQ